ncbi:MAG: ribokinase [Herpetosiphon sp.]
MSNGSHQARICVVGSAMIDLVAYVPRLPKTGETMAGTSFKQGFGGKGSNQAVTAARLGASVTMVVKLGDDDFGRSIIENYRRQGIDTRFVFFEPGHSSGVAPITVDADGRNTVIIVPGANTTLSSSDVNAANDAIRAAGAVICQCEVPDAANIAAFRIARDAGVLTILNPAPARPLPPELLALTDLLVPNETETELLTAQSIANASDAAHAATLLRAQGAKTVIITLGERGALVMDDDGPTEIPTVPVQAIDSTGAGDAFIGSLAYYLVQGRSLRDAVTLANLVAALSVTRPGTQTSFPTPAELAAFTTQSGRP